MCVCVYVCACGRKGVLEARPIKGTAPRVKVCGVCCLLSDGVRVYVCVCVSVSAHAGVESFRSTAHQRHGTACQGVWCVLFAERWCACVCQCVRACGCGEF